MRMSQIYVCSCININLTTFLRSRGKTPYSIVPLLLFLTDQVSRVELLLEHLLLTAALALRRRGDDAAAGAAAVHVEQLQDVVAALADVARDEDEVLRRVRRHHAHVLALLWDEESRGGRSRRRSTRLNGAETKCSYALRRPDLIALSY